MCRFCKKTKIATAQVDKEPREEICLEALECKRLNLQDCAFGVAKGIVGNHEDAKDIAQESLVKFYFKFDPSRNHLKALVRKIAVNKSIDFLRQQQANGGGEMFLEDLHTLPDALVRNLVGERYACDFDPYNTNQPDTLESQEIKALVRKAFRRLKEYFPNEATVLFGIELEGRGYKAIAEAIEKPVDYVRVIYSRARKHLKRFLLEEGLEHDDATRLLSE